MYLSLQSIDGEIVVESKSLSTPSLHSQNDSRSVSQRPQLYLRSTITKITCMPHTHAWGIHDILHI
eukprot:COSAG05_NODE_214_length_13907_cov_28.992178_26_plen_66_part_00